MKFGQKIFVSVQVKYKQDSEKEASGSLYHQLSETAETQLAKELRDVYSEVRNASLKVPNASNQRGRVGKASSLTGEVQRRGEEGDQEELVLAPPGDGGDRVCQADVRGTE